MNNLSFADWYRSTGSLRVGLLVLAIFGKVLLFIFNPPYYTSGGPLILPFAILVILDIAWAVVGSIIIVECVRIIAYRSTSSWTLKRHLLILFVFIVALAIYYVLIIVPKKSRTYNHYGWSLSEKKDYKQSITNLNIAIKYNQKNIKAYLERGYAHRELGNFAAALSDYNEVIAMDSKNASGYEGKGYVYYYLGEHEKALKEWKAALALDPQSISRLEKWIKAVEKK